MIDANATFRRYLDRQHDVLLTVGHEAPLRRDLELHVLTLGTRQEPGILQLLGDAIAAMALYLVSRPRFEYFGWTIHFESPLLNIFVAGAAREHTVVGRSFSEGVHPAGKALFYAQIGRPFGELQTSSVEVSGSDVFGLVEQYCLKSDQQLVRLFRGPDGKVALLTSLPATHRQWFSAVKAQELFGLAEAGAIQLIAEHEVSFACGCDTDRIAKLVVDLYREDPEDLLQGEPAVEVECPRCGTKHWISRDLFDSKAKGR